MKAMDGQLTRGEDYEECSEDTESGSRSRMGANRWLERLSQISESQKDSYLIESAIVCMPPLLSSL